jgi:hypothetical protein
LTGLLWLACCILPTFAWAMRPVRVYEVDTSGQSTPALQDAMRQALVRATGRRETANDPALASVISDAPKYVKSFVPGPRGSMRVIFDSVAVERAIVAAGRSVWDTQRPFTLVVLYPPLSRGAEDSARAELEQEAAARGLLVSVVPLPIVDANGAELGGDAILQTAQRYGGDQVLVGRADAGTASGQWRWTLYTSFSSESWTGPLAAGIDGTVDLLAPAPGATLAQTDADARVEIDGVGGLADYANIERMLEGIPGVRKATISEANGTRVTFDVTLRGGAEALDHALSASNRLARSGTSNARLVYQYHP